MKTFIFLIIFLIPLYLNAQQNSFNADNSSKDEEHSMTLIGIEYCHYNNQNSFNNWLQSINYHKLNPYNFGLTLSHFVKSNKYDKLILGVTGNVNINFNYQDASTSSSSFWLNIGYPLYSRKRIEAFIFTGIGLGTTYINFRTTPPVQINPEQKDNSYYLKSSSLSNITKITILFKHPKRSNFINIGGIDFGLVADPFYKKWKFGRSYNAPHSRFHGTRVDNLPLYQPLGLSVNILFGVHSLSSN